MNYPVNIVRLTEDSLREIVSSDSAANFTGYGVWVLRGHDEVSAIGSELERILQEEFTIIREAKFVGVWGRLYFKYRIPELDIFNFNGGQVTTSHDGESIVMFTNGVVESAPVSFPQGRYRLFIYCKGTEADGEFPRVKVQIGGSKIGSLKTTNVFQDFRLDFSLEHAESANVRIFFDNDAFNRETGEDRNLFIKSVMIIGPYGQEE